MYEAPLFRGILVHHFHLQEVSGIFPFWGGGGEGRGA